MSERYLVVGLARSGVAACEAILRMWPGAEVLATDSRSDLDVGRLRALGVEPVLGGDVVPVEGLSAVVKSPGVPSQTDQVDAARTAGVPIWSEVELAARMLPNPIAGVTGTNGKTTTTELLGAMLRTGGVPCEVAGNVGRPLTSLAGRIDAGRLEPGHVDARSRVGAADHRVRPHPADRVGRRQAGAAQADDDEAVAHRNFE